MPRRSFFFCEQPSQTYTPFYLRRTHPAQAFSPDDAAHWKWSTSTRKDPRQCIPSRGGDAPTAAALEVFRPCSAPSNVIQPGGKCRPGTRPSYSARASPLSNLQPRQDQRDDTPSRSRRRRSESPILNSRAPDLQPLGTKEVALLAELLQWDGTTNATPGPLEAPLR